jgi:hypothetical protein
MQYCRIKRTMRWEEICEFYELVKRFDEAESILRKMT